MQTLTIHPNTYLEEHDNQNPKTIATTTTGNHRLILIKDSTEAPEPTEYGVTIEQIAGSYQYDNSDRADAALQRLTIEGLQRYLKTFHDVTYIAGFKIPGDSPEDTKTGVISVTPCNEAPKGYEAHMAQAFLQAYANWNNVSYAALYVQERRMLNVTRSSAETGEIVDMDVVESWDTVDVMYGIDLGTLCDDRDVMEVAVNTAVGMGYDLPWVSFLG